MNDPANVRTPSEQAEHEALSQKIFDTVFPPPTLAETRLNMMAASPIGATLSVFTGAVGGSQLAQDRALIAGSVADTFMLGRGLQPGGQTSITAGAIRPKTKGMPEAQLSAIGRSAPVPLSAAEAASTRTWSNTRNSYLKMWREVDTSAFPAETRQLLWGKADNSIRNNMTPNDLAGVMKERRGIVILKSDGVTPYDHVGEWEQARASINKAITGIQNRLDHLGALAQRGSQEYNILQQKRADLSKILDSYEALQVVK
jgi:hypothetical protein